MAKNEVEIRLRNNFAGLLVSQGVLAVLFGVAALFWPGLTLATFILLFGAFTLVWGVVLLVNSLMGSSYRSLWWVETLLAVLLVGLGVFLLRNPGVVIATLLLLVGFTLIARGIVDVVSGLFSSDKHVVDNRWFVIINGVLGLILGVIVLNYPVSSGLAFIWALGLYAVLYGALTVSLAFRIHTSEQ